jgi:hypothetical protein
MKNIKRMSLKNHDKDANEEIMVFTKHEDFEGPISKIEDLDEW